MIQEDVNVRNIYSQLTGYVKATCEHSRTMSFSERLGLIDFLIKIHKENPTANNIEWVKDMEDVRVKIIQDNLNTK